MDPLVRIGAALADRWRSGAEQRSWRWLTRTGVQLKKKWGVIHSHVEVLLEQGGIKLSAVVSDLFGSAGGPCWNSSGGA